MKKERSDIVMKKESKVVKSKTSKATAPKTSVMRPNSGQSGKEFRKLAEIIVRGGNPQQLENIDKMSPAQIKKMLHELRVHQVELELQNEELLRAQMEMDALRARYFDLYDLAPVGYLTVSKQGLILETNLTTATLLGVNRSTLSKQQLTRFIIKEDQDIYYRHRKELFETGEPQKCELRMVKKDGAGFWALLDAIAAKGADGAPVYRVMISDINKQKLIEEALREKEVQYRHLADSGIALIWTSGTDKLCNYFNVPWLKFTGRNLEQEMGNGWVEGVHPDDLESCVKTYVTAFDKREAFDMEYRLRHISGEYRWIRDLGTPNYDSNGAFIGYIGHCFDITENKQTRLNLQERIKELNCLYSISALVELPGISLDEIIKGVVMLIPPAWQFPGITEASILFAGQTFQTARFRKTSWMQVSEIIGSGNPVGRVEVCYLEEREASDEGPFLKEERMLLNAVAERLGRIIEGKQAEAALRDSEERFNILSNATWEGIIIHKEGIILDANESALKMFGYPAEEVIGKNIIDFIAPESTAPALQKLREGATHDQLYLQLNILRKDKTILSAEALGKPIRYKNLDARVISIRDITNRKLAEVYREMGREVLEILNEPGDLQDEIKGILAVLKTHTGCDAVGIRLQEGEDFPYLAQEGLSKDFLLTENTLIERDADGGACRDKDGKVRLECTCGLVISGKTDPVNPLFTPGGSFWTNDSFPILDIPPADDLRIHPRNRCMNHGYASLAMVPIRGKQRVVGMIQLNDRRKGLFTIEAVELLEGIGAQIGSALMRKQAERMLRESDERSNMAQRSAHIGIWDHDLITKRITWSPIMFDLFGLDPQKGMPSFDEFTSIIFSEDRDAVAHNIESSIRDNVAVSNEYRIVLSSGQLRWINSQGHAIYDDQMQPVRMSGICMDITGRKLMEIELAESREDLENRVKERTCNLENINVLLAEEIEERRKAEVKLLISNAYNRSLLESSIDPLVTINHEGILTDVNRATEEATGYLRNELIGSAFSSYFTEPDRALATYQNVFKGAEVRGYEVELKSRNGTIMPVLVNASLYHDENGKAIGVLATARDITEYKNMHNALQESQELFRKTLDLGVVGMATTHPDTYYFLSANEHLCKMIGYTEEELLKKTWVEITFPKEKVDEDSVNLSKLLSGEWNGYVMEKQYQHKDGHMIDITLSVQGVRKKDGTIDYILILIDDITERKRAEEDIRRLNERISVATRSAQVGIWDWDVTNNLLVWDDQLYALYGFKKEEFSGAYEAWVKGLHPDDRTAGDALVKQALQSGKDYDSEFRVIWPDGTLHFLKSRGNIIRDADGKAVRMIGINYDITDRKMLEQSKIDREAAEVANRAKSIFVANMSHEIRTPMNAILGFAQVLERDPSLTPQQVDHVRTIHRSTEHLLRLINDILDISKIEAGYTSLDESVFNLHYLLDDLELMFTARTNTKGLQLLVERDDSVPRYVTADEGKLRQVLVNLLGNAVKFTVTGGIAMRVRAKAVEGKNVEDKEYLRLEVEVEDTGPGIHPEDMERIFDIFQQGSAGVNAGGTGLGLGISRRVVEMMGGKITVTSQVGKGSCFRFSALLRPAADVAPQEKRARRRIIGMVPGTEAVRILAVDDIPDNRALLCALLRPLGFEVAEAENGVEALDVFERWSPHAVLMDMRMPIMDGYEATRRIKDTAAGKTTPIIATTASAFEDARERVMETGVCAYVRKPFRMEEICEELGKCLDLRFIYADEATAAPDHLKAASLTGESLAALPGDMVEAMRLAVAGGNMALLMELITQVKKVDSATAHALQALANQYDYEKLGQLLNKGEMTNG